MAKKQPSFQQMLLDISEKLKTESAAPNIKKYTPHEKQEKFHASEQKARVYIGGNRSGKTTGGVTEAIWRATCTHPYRPDLNAIGANRGRVVAVDFINGVEKIIFPQYKQWLYPSALRGGSWEAAYDRFTKTLNFANGSTIEFMSYDQDLDKFAGTSRHWTHFDEEPPRPIWVECLARLVDTDGDYWITMTPVEGMNWIYDELYEPNHGKAPEDQTVELIEISSLENPYLPEAGLQRLIDSVDADDVTTRIGGGYVRQGGLIYKNFDPTPGHGQVLKEPILEPAKYFPARNWMWIMCLDHGLNNPTAVLWIALNEAGFGVIFDEWYKSEMTIDQHSEVIKKRWIMHGRVPDIMVADPSIKNRNPVTMTSIHEEYLKNGIPFILGNNDKPAGIVRVKKYWNKHNYVGTSRERHPLFGGIPRPEDANQQRIFNNDGLYHRLLVSPACPMLIWEAKRYRWKTYTDKKKQYENNPYDEPHDKDNHALDAVRYGLMTQPDLFANNNEMNEAKLNDIVDSLGNKIIANRNHEIDDPNGLLNPERGWDPTGPMPNEHSQGDWVYDEHMGGLM